MKNFLSAVKKRLGLGTALGTVSAFLLYGALAAGDETRKDPQPPKKSVSSRKKAEKQPERTLSGAELYALHCNRCHPERYAPERTAEQWKTILLHMRTRANLPADQARAILQYLQEDSGK
jgi:hypothetical protein